MNIELHQTDTALSEADIHDILRNDRRRNVIKRLQEHGREISLRELSVHIAEIESGESPPPSDVRNSVYVSLHQTHLPKLDKEGIVEYDNDQKTIVLQESARQVSLYMEVITQYGITWATYYRAIGVLALFSVVLVSTDLPLVSVIDPPLCAAFFMLVIVVSTLYQLWSRRWFYFHRFR
jgi:hypothetical protein